MISYIFCPFCDQKHRKNDPATLPGQMYARFIKPIYLLKTVKCHYTSTSTDLAKWMHVPVLTRKLDITIQAPFLDSLLVGMFMFTFHISAYFRNTFHISGHPCIILYLLYKIDWFIDFCATN